MEGRDKDDSLGTEKIGRDTRAAVGDSKGAICDSMNQRALRQLLGLIFSWMVINKYKKINHSGKIAAHN